MYNFVALYILKHAELIFTDFVDLKFIHVATSGMDVWHCVLGIAPTYLFDLFTLILACSGRQSLRSASTGDFVVPHARTAIK